MSPCKYCNDLDIPSYRTVVQSRPPGEYNAFSAIPSNEPRGIKPYITITIDDILSGAGIFQCDACVMLRNALLAISNGSLEEVREIECQGNISGTLDVTTVLHSGFEEEFEFYTHAGQLFFCSPSVQHSIVQSTFS
jgi:hypothetical protein